MEKADFLDRVATALAQRGMTDAEILRYTEKTSALLDKLPAEELGAVLSDRVDADRFAAELLAEEKPVKKPEPSPAAQRAALPVTKVPVPPAAQKPTVPAAQKAPTPAQQQTAPAGRPAQTPAAQRQTAPASAPQKAPAAPAGRPAQTPAAQRQTAPAPAPQKAPAAPAGRPAQAPAQKPSVPSAPSASSVPARGAEQDARMGVSAKTEVVIDTGKVPSHPFSDRGKEKQKQQAAGGAVARDNRDYSRFWLIFWLTLPFTLILGLAGAAVFLGLIAVLVLSIVGLTALLIAVSVAGTALALVGIIYGAIQLFSGSGPAGLYEIGEGLMIAGGTMLAGILLYNAAVRLAPFLIRKTARLIGVTAKALKKLFLKIKGAMAQ